jgi:hypothetical protein
LLYRPRADGDPRAPADAFQIVNSDGPLIIVTGALLQGTKNDDEAAFVMGHEAGHHIAKHLDKQQQQQLAGALIIGMATTYAGGNSDAVGEMMDAGAGIGGIAYSQTYELEADMLGAYIAEAAGYDAEKGSLLFARREGGNVRAEAGAMSLWSTHPRSPQRVATVRYAVADARAKKAAGEPLRRSGGRRSRPSATGAIELEGPATRCAVAVVLLKFVRPGSWCAARPDVERKVGTLATRATGGNHVHATGFSA